MEGHNPGPVVPGREAHPRTKRVGRPPVPSSREAHSRTKGAFEKDLKPEPELIEIRRNRPRTNAAIVDPGRGKATSNDRDSAAIVEFGHEAGHLKHVARAGWLLAGVRNGESVAEHSWRVGVLAYCIAVQEGANPDRAAALGLFHDLPETRIGDVPSVGKRYVQTADPRGVVADQVAELPTELGNRIAALVAEHESAKTPDATLEAKCSRDADKIECLLQAREYQREGYTQLDQWVTTMADAVTTTTGKRLAAAALDVSPAAWWDTFARTFGQPTR